MDFFKLFSKKPPNPKNVINYEDVWGSAYSGGYSITPNTAVGQSAVWACINLLSSSIASLPITVYKVDEDGFKKPDIDSSLYSLLRFAPNNFQTINDFITSQMYALLIHGESFARIYKNSRNEVTSLIPLNNQGVTVSLNATGTALQYEVTYSNKTSGKTSDILNSSQVLHIRGLFSEILKPLSPISACRQTFQINGVLHDHQMAFFAEGAAKPGGVIEASGKVAPTTIKRILSIFNKSSAGVHNSGKTLFLEEGLTFKPIQLNNVDSQFLELMKFSIPEVCRVFNVPTSLVHDNEKSTFSNAEQQSLSFVTYSLRPYIEKFENAMLTALVPKTQWATTEIDFNVAALLRGDATTQSNYVSKLIQNAVMTPNEGREFLGMSPSDQEGADDLFIQQNMSALQNIDEPQTAGASAINPGPTESTVEEDQNINAVFLANNLLDLENKLLKGQKI